MQKKSKTGSVFLVGAGPGDPSLLTLRALEILNVADVVLYDKLMSEDILAHVKSDAQLVFVGKQSCNHTMPQGEINNLLAEHALKGKTVVRLKGGDPFVFGRGGEEGSHLRSLNIPFQFVPGVSSAIAVPEYAGIPVTDRRAASSFAVITGHMRRGDSEAPWTKEQLGSDTLVFLMSHGNIDKIATNLIKNGKKPNTPVAIIEKGCSSEQRVIEGTIETIADLAKQNDTKTPAIIIVGDVVSLRKELAWREALPLTGRKILVTRPQHQSHEILKLLRDAGAHAISRPLISIKTLPAQQNLPQILSEADWILFTSANGLPSLLSQLDSIGKDIRSLGQAKLGAIGTASAQTLRDKGLKVDFVPSAFVGDAFAAELPDIQGKRVVIAKAKESRDILDKVLTERGAIPIVIPVYETLHESICLPDMTTLSMTILTSPSTVKSFLKNAPNALSPVACIGPITAAAARNAGLEVAVEAKEYTAPALVDAICEYFKGDKK